MGCLHSLFFFKGAARPDAERFPAGNPSSDTPAAENRE
jgi:hypothetical protein